MTPSYMERPAEAVKSRQKQGFKEMAVFGLRKIFVDPAPRPRGPKPRFAAYLQTDALGAQWLPE